jgi:RimJ/RimL family protein N-acetyltransferase
MVNRLAVVHYLHMPGVQNMLIPPMPSRLSDDVLARRTVLPRKPAPVTLQGQYVSLAPLDLERDVAPLFALSNGQPATLGERRIDTYDAEALVWRFMPEGPFATPTELKVCLQKQVDSPNGLCMCVYDRVTGQPLGAANFMSNSPEHLKIELGWIWYSPLAQRTNANTEATYLMLKHAFGLGYRRLEWKCNALNERSRRAALRMGFKFEGIQESHMIVKNCNRDTAWFRILDHEWPAVQTHLETLLYAK